MEQSAFKNIKTFLFLVFVFLLFSSCGKSKKSKCNETFGREVEDCEPRHLGNISLGGAMDYLYFKPGSWWVYKNNLTSQIDSIYTVQCDTGVGTVIGSNQPWLSISYTSIAFHLRSDIYGMRYSYGEPLVYPYLPDFTFQSSLDRTVNMDNWYSYNIRTVAAFAYPFKGNHYNKFIELKPSMDIQKYNYQDVAIFETMSDESIPPTAVTGDFRGNARYYWAKGVGLVMYEAMSQDYSGPPITEKWELIKCNLVR